jgi:hypothetical protein
MVISGAVPAAGSPGPAHPDPALRRTPHHVTPPPEALSAPAGVRNSCNLLLLRTDAPATPGVRRQTGVDLQEL